MTARKPYDLSTADHDYPPWEGAPRRSILICTIPRSGSTLLGEAIYFAGGLGCPLEYFHAGFRPFFETRWNARSLPELRAALWRNRTDPSGTLSIKLMWRDIQELAAETDMGTFAPLIEAPPERIPAEIYREAARLVAELLPSPTCVHLVRRDRVRQAVSACIAHETGQWRAIPGGENDPVAEPEYDAAAIEHQISYGDVAHRHWRNLLAAMPEPPVALAYEDLARDYEGSVTALLRQLGSTGAPPPVRMRRQSDPRSETFVRRFLLDKGQREQTGADAAKP